jgi:hypothetical protein
MLGKFLQDKTIAKLIPALVQFVTRKFHGMAYLFEI